MLQSAAATVQEWKNREYGNALTDIGRKEFEMLKFFWGDRDPIPLDTGTEMVVVDANVLAHRGWTVEVVPEDTYMQLVNAENQLVMQLFANGMVPPEVGLKHIPALTPEEKQMTLQYLQMQQAAAVAAEANSGSRPAAKASSGK